MRHEDLVDLTLRLGPTTALFPGDPPTRLSPFASWGEAGYRASRLSLSVHAGTHVDAPLHLSPGGADAASLPLRALVGPAQVVDCGATGVATRRRLAAAAPLAPRLLLKTGGGTSLRSGKAGRGHLAADAAAWLVAGGVLLVGIESLSIDAVGAEDLPAHRTLLAAGVVVLEGVDLDQVQAGAGELVCLPLPLAASDGAPARVLLRTRAPRPRLSAALGPRCT